MTLDVLHQLLLGWAGLAAMMAVLWAIQLRTKDAGTVDVGWSFGLGLLAIFYAFTSEGYLSRRMLLAFATGAWSFRLGLYLLFNRVLGKEEDGRYQSLRRQWGDRSPLYFFLFFEAQALLDVVFSLPFLVVAHSNRPALTIWDGLGAAILVVSIVGESIADRQLARFRARSSSRGKTCREGLWRYSRHPNYFFEWLHWWSYVLMAIGAQWWALTLLGPALMLLFLFKVTGIPATEQHALESRGEDYRDYQRTTSMFIPWFPQEENK